MTSDDFDEVPMRTAATSAKSSIVADGRERTMRALWSTPKERAGRLKELRQQLEASHRHALQPAGFFRRIALRRKIGKEAERMMRREFGIPSDTALFFLSDEWANKALQPTSTAGTSAAEPPRAPAALVADL